MPADLPASESSPNIFRLLLWLKWTLLWRGYSRQKLRIVGIALTILFFAPLSIGLAVLCYMYGRDNAEILPVMTKAILSTTYLIWLLTPLLGFALNESYDPSRLFVYPVPLRTIFAASVVGGLFEVSTIMVMPVFIVLAILSSPSVLASLIAIGALLLFILHTLALAQLVMLSLVGFLRSRRFRDITIVLFPLLAMLYYVVQQSALYHMTEYNFGDFQNWSIWRFVAIIPPGWAAESVSCGARGDYIGAFWNLTILAIATVLPVYAAAIVMKGLYVGDRGPLPTAENSATLNRIKVASQGIPAPSPFWERNSDIAAMIHKEFIYFAREPQYKALLINMIYTIFVMFFAYGLRSGAFFESPRFQSYASYGESPLTEFLQIVKAFLLPTVLLLASMPLVFNIFGGDASAISVLMSFPVKRIRLIVAKNLAHAPIVIVLGIVGVTGAALLLRQTSLLPLELTWIALATPVMMGAGNLVSIRFPHKMVVRGQRFGKGGQASISGGGAGCGYAFVYLGCYGGALALLIPVAAAVAAPIIFDCPGILVATIPLALVYSGLSYWTATNMAGKMLEKRETALINSLLPDD